MTKHKIDKTLQNALELDQCGEDGGLYLQAVLNITELKQLATHHKRDDLAPIIQDALMMKRVLARRG